MPRRLSFPRLRLLEQPAVFVALPFLGGLLTSAYTHFSLKIWILTALNGWIVATISLFLPAAKRARITLLLLCSYFCGGALWAIDSVESGPQNIRRVLEQAGAGEEDPIEVVGTLQLAPELAPDRIYLFLAVEKIRLLGVERDAAGGIQLSVPFRDAESRVEYDRLGVDYGSRVRTMAFVRRKSGYRNPGAPDFGEILQYRGIDAVGWVKSPLLIEKIGEGPQNRALAALYRIRSRAIRSLLRGLKQPGSGILAAALFGNRHFLSQDAAEIFRAGGTFHLLIISGLHIAMIAVVVMELMKAVSRSNLIRYSFVIVVMWAYALMVGAEAAITRSVVMLSIALIGRMIFRASVGPNTLAVTAIVLLAWRPQDLFNPAFHLTFLTVLAIVAIVSPLSLRLKKIGEWRPSPNTPYPPRVSRGTKWIAELLFWDERKFQAMMREARVRYRLEKSPSAIFVNRWRLQTTLAWIAGTLLATITVQLCLLPLMILHFHRFSAISPIANVLESALVFVLMVAGVGYLSLSFLIGGWAAPLAKLVDVLGSLTVGAGEWLLRWKAGSFRTPDWGAGEQAVFGLYFLSGLILVVCLNEWNPFRKGDEPGVERGRRRGWRLVLAAAALMTVIGALLVFHPFQHEFEPGRLVLTFLDVGQGDATLIRFPRGTVMLLDSGGAAGVRARQSDTGAGEGFVEDRIGIGEAAVAPYLWRLGVKRLDWIVASHADSDHVGGFPEIARAFAVTNALRGASAHAGPDLFDQAALLSNASMRTVRRGDGFELDGARIDVLSPSGEVGASPRSENNDSLVLKISFGRRSFLLPGDIERGMEQELSLTEREDLRADALKVAHHGSRTSSTDEFLQSVRPRIAVISVAEPSPFGHPHPEALARLHSIDASIFRTSRCGAITLSTDGEDLRVASYIKCESEGRSGDRAWRSSP
jgi:competence protein ComEC